MPRSRSTRPVFDETFDVAVIGGGHAGFAATMQATRLGLTTVLIERLGDLVTESGRSFAGVAGSSDDPVWRQLTDRVDRLGGLDGDWLDGALTECVATTMLRDGAAASLYYATLIGVDLDDTGLVQAAQLATRAGRRRIRARRWIDATATGELVRLLAPSTPSRQPDSTHRWMFLQHPDWDSVLQPGGTRRTAWPSERAVPVNPAPGPWTAGLLGTLDQVAETVGSTELARLCLSHFSFAPFRRYEASKWSPPELPGNVAVATPAHLPGKVSALADLHRLGIHATLELPDHPIARPGNPPAAYLGATETPLRTDLAIVGAGTGGVLATIAAARAGVQVHALEGSPHVGGVGTVGGIHVYWFGAPGGLQAELDDQTRALMHAYGRGPLRDGPFNPWAKLIAAEQLLATCGATLTREAVLFDVERDGGRVTAIHCATPTGILRVEAEAFIDATGDGDLCALAGADFRLGRDTDGLLHAYSQSSGRLRTLRGEPRMDTVNFDAGFCDPTDPTDLTRARQDGIAAYLIDHEFAETHRPTYFAPALGIRQGRQITTDLTLTLDDLVRRRRFPDAVGYTAAHFDNHATDMQFESDEAVLYQWVLAQARTPIGCELSYRQLLPVGLTNLWIGSRCLGLSQEAQYVTRMQRDIQRVGEVAGIAAALAIQGGVDSRSIDIDDLQRRLTASKALGVRPRALETTFGLYERVSETGRIQFSAHQATDEQLLAHLGGDAVEFRPADVAAALDAGRADPSLWWAAHNPSVCHEEVHARLAHANPTTSWLAACIAGMWSDPAAEPRLLAAIESLEPAPTRHQNRTHEGSEAGPSESGRSAPRWLTALVLLRRCGTAACIPVIAELAAIPTHAVDTLTAIALTVTRLAERLPDRRHHEALTQVIQAIASATPLGDTDYSARNVGAHSHEAATHGRAAPDHATATQLAEPFATQIRATYQSRSWQLALAIDRSGLSRSGPSEERQVDSWHRTQ